MSAGDILIAVIVVVMAMIIIVLMAMVAAKDDPALCRKSWWNWPIWRPICVAVVVETEPPKGTALPDEEIPDEVPAEVPANNSAEPGVVTRSAMLNELRTNTTNQLRERGLLDTDPVDPKYVRMAALETIDDCDLLSDYVKIESGDMGASMLKYACYQSLGRCDKLADLRRDACNAMEGEAKDQCMAAVAADEIVAECQAIPD